MKLSEITTGLLLLALILPAAALATPPGVAEQWRHLDPKSLKLRSKNALITDSGGDLVYAKEADVPVPIASITKLMTALVILDSGVDMEERIKITKADRDLLRLTGSRLRYGATLPRRELLLLALMSSENRAASALARTFPGGAGAFVAAMNEKAAELGMTASRFVDATGLDAGNIASARDLARLAGAAYQQPLIRNFTTSTKATVRPYKRLGPLVYGNTNRLLKRSSWQIGLSKTGYINEAGRCLVMRAKIDGEALTMIFLNAYGKLTPLGDAGRLRRWIENASDKRSQLAQDKTSRKEDDGA
ncbi:MAG: hypothetical protein B0D96_00320 [Candidatus Sedimenticola endophacoides]|uniref:Peptidase S11 n=3 Tax=Candidatus Sedimenticola endophacoides TaxID=2548426 RepID=A0A6N4E196_9GAMM|nr:MAG: hypothetical protein B0D94_09050 [Candidatus Sedimenticola endophacoides]OQX38373.1 MAG: hypothetical protein B0D96_00320 [Candidatus Sedimenticola endophacoides]OQX38558.1 MAG: hypothetical protein B0D89_12495 [Candidatus Sedimenticola endophacoides]PUE00926.1 MAG: peptidase S11 [Candidatus Sedimenticola endophacoides]PUE02828.1 MAG: peptidase S11 [Candidatus Sedimenticola endophacoides]